MPDRFGGGGETYVHPIVAIAMVVVFVAMFAVNRRKVIVPFLAASFLIPMDQVLVVGPFHFQMLRLLVMFGCIRIAIVKFSSGLPVFPGGFKAIDKVVTLWAVMTAIDVVLLWKDSAALINQLGLLYTVLGIYVVLRCFIRDREEVELAIRTFAWIAILMGIMMSLERITGRNPYVILGGPRAWTRAALMNRDGKFRATGSFQHPILAGAFGSVLIPLFIAIKKRYGKTAVFGIIGATVMVIASNSSTPLSAYGAGLFAFAFWKWRDRMRPIRWAVLLGLITLHLVMKAPVWALIARIDFTGGSSSYHRFMLVDQCIRHFGDWWLVGTKNFADWGWDMWDLANQYVAIADTSGLIPLALFIAMIVYGFKFLGRARNAIVGDKRSEFFLWSLGAALFANLIAFMGISYYDQTMVVWYALLAMISAASLTVTQGETPPLLSHKEADPDEMAEVPSLASI